MNINFNKKECDDGCATCSTSGSCGISCPTNCLRCEPDLKCLESAGGYYVHPVSKTVIGILNNIF